MVERDSLSIRLLRVVFRIYHNISARKSCLLPLIVPQPINLNFNVILFIKMNMLILF